MKYSIVSQQCMGSILVLLFLCLPQATQACTCAAYPDDLEKAVTLAYAQADVIFLGDAMAMRSRFRGFVRQREVTFRVRDRWKGSIPDTTLLRTNIGEAACGFNFRKGNSYLVFAHWDPQERYLMTSICELTRTEAKAKGAISELDRLSKRELRGQ